MEVMDHPWMRRGFSGPPDPHLIPRKPLRPDGLDKDIIRGIGSFGFGREEEIEKKLVEVLESDAYRRVMQDWERKQAIDNPQHDVVDDKYWSSLSDASLGYESTEIDSSRLTSKNSNCFSGFSLCGQKLLSLPFSSSFTLMSCLSPHSQPPPSHGDTGETVDPTHGFHPLVSIYFLAQEKAERERTCDPRNLIRSWLSIGVNVCYQ